METISFYTDDISINVHSSTFEPFLGHSMTLREFAAACNGRRFSLQELEDGDLLYTCRDSGEFIQGAEV